MSGEVTPFRAGVQRRMYQRVDVVLNNLRLPHVLWVALAGALRPDGRGRDPWHIIAEFPVDDKAGAAQAAMTAAREYGGLTIWDSAGAFQPTGDPDFYDDHGASLTRPPDLNAGEGSSGG